MATRCGEIIETHEQKKERFELGIKRLTLSVKQKEFILETIKKQLRVFQKDLDDLGDFPREGDKLMSTKVEKFRKYIKGTYEKFGEIDYSNYWNLGYIDCLGDNKIVTPAVGAGLAGYNDKRYFIEQTKIMGRRKEIMLERIGNKVDERIKLVYKKLMPERGCTGQTTEFLNEVHTAMAIYKELIQKIACMDEDRFNYQFCWKGELLKYIEGLEEKYYPQPKSQSAKEKINDILNDYFARDDSARVISSLVKLRDELPE